MIPTHTESRDRRGTTLCNKFIPVGRPVGTIERDSTLGDWPIVTIAANPSRPTCGGCQRKLKVMV